MSVRAVWVFSADKTCLLSRRWPTVERRVKARHGDSYSSLPADSELLTQEPPLKLLLVRLERNGLLLLAAPVDKESQSLALALLDSLAGILSAKPAALGEARSFLSCSAPFGSPLDLSPANTSAQLLPRARTATSQGKTPSWAALTHKGAPKVSLSLREELCAMQYDQSELSDSWTLSGSLLCKAEIEGAHDLQVNLTTPSPLEGLVFHPAVQSQGRGIRFHCSAPHTLALAHYTASLPSLPIRGFYQMKGEESVRLLIQLKLADGVRNGFEWCEVHAPFFNRGNIVRVDNVVPAGLAGSLATAGNTLIWSIGGKFPSKSLQLSLQATVTFSGEPSFTDSPFLVGSNSYIEVLFKMSDYTLSGTSIDSKGVTLLPPTLKPRISISREVSSKSYRIWNSHGESLAVFSQNRTQ